MSIASFSLSLFEFSSFVVDGCHSSIVLLCSCSSKGIEFVRRKLDEPLAKPRTVLMNVQMWSKITSHKEEILDAMRDHRPLVVKLNDIGSRQLTVEEFEADGNWYVGFQSIGIRGVQGYASMNFTLGEFYTLLHDIDNINEALATNKNIGKRSSALSGRDKTADEQMLVYWYTWMLGDDCYLRGDLLYNRDSDCREAAERAVDRSDPALQGLRLEVASKFVTIWQPCDMVRWIFYLVVWGLVRQLEEVGTKCVGCSKADRSIAAHRCLNTDVSQEEMERKASQYLVTAKSMVSVNTLSRVFEEVRKRIGGSSRVWAHMYAETFLAFAEPSNTMVKSMAQFLTSPEESAKLVTIKAGIMSYLETFVFPREGGAGASLAMTDQQIYRPPPAKVARGTATVIR